MSTTYRCLCAFIVWVPTAAVAGGNAAGGGVRSVNVDFIGLELLVGASLLLVHRRLSSRSST